MSFNKDEKAMVLEKISPTFTIWTDKKMWLKLILKFLARQYMAVVVVMVALILSIPQPAILSAGNISSVLFQAALTGIAACGMTLLITAGMLDLSVPGIIALTSLTAAGLLSYTSPIVAVSVGLVVGAVCGLLNGCLVAYVKIPAFIATMGTQYLYLGIVFVITRGGVFPVNSEEYTEFANLSVRDIPVAFIVFIGLAIIVYFLLYWTHFGRDIRSIGSNNRAARLAGVSVNYVIVLAFIIGGITFAITGFFLSGLLYSASGTMAIGFELNAIAAVVVGGTSLRGGRATLFGTMVGAVLFSLLSNALNLLRVSSYWQYVLTGVVLAVAVAIGSLRRRQQAVRGAD